MLKAILDFFQFHQFAMLSLTSGPLLIPFLLPNTFFPYCLSLICSSALSMNILPPGSLPQLLCTGVHTPPMCSAVLDASMVMEMITLHYLLVTFLEDCDHHVKGQDFIVHYCRAGT